jgi:hypothetical protein
MFTSMFIALIANDSHTVVYVNKEKKVIVEEYKKLLLEKSYQ